MPTYSMGSTFSLMVDADKRHEAEEKLQDIMAQIAALGATISTDPDVLRFFEDEDELFLTDKGFQTHAEMEAEEKADSDSRVFRVIWNHDGTDLHYDVPAALLREFRDRIVADGMNDAWDWFIDHVDYDGNNEKPIGHKNVAANHNYVEVELDHDFPDEFVNRVWIAEQT